jgi:hypothetical protein
MSQNPTEKQLKNIKEQLSKLDARTRKILNVITDADTLNRSMQYEEIEEMVMKRGTNGVKTQEVAEILDINPRNAYQHMRKIANQNPEIVYFSGRGQKSAKLYNEKVLPGNFTKNPEEGKVPDHLRRNPMLN